MVKFENLTPYRQAAYTALVKWNRVAEEEALKQVQNDSFDALDEATWGASKSMLSAIDGIAKELGLTEKEIQEYKVAALAKDRVSKNTKDLDIYSTIAAILETVDNKEKMVIRILSTVHDGWVKDCAKNFTKPNREGKRYQHLPLECLGFEEAKSDLVFLEPLLRSSNVHIDMKKLEAEYNLSVNKFMQENGLVTEDGRLNKGKLASKIMEGKDFYAPLTDENTAKTQDVAEQMVEQVEGKVGNLIERTIR